MPASNQRKVKSNPRKVKVREKVRLPKLKRDVATEEEAQELRKYVNREWPHPGLPSLVERWWINVADGYEELTLKRAVLDIKKLQATLDAQPELICRMKVFKGRRMLLLFFKGFEDVTRAWGETGIITREGIELSLAVPEPLRLKIIRLLPEHLVTS